MASVCHVALIVRHWGRRHVIEIAPFRGEATVTTGLNHSEHEGLEARHGRRTSEARNPEVEVVTFGQLRYIIQLR
jgi:hypothetical protein